MDRFNGVFCSKKKAHEATAGRGVRVVLVLVVSFVVVVALVVVRAPLLVVVWVLFIVSRELILVKEQGVGRMWEGCLGGKGTSQRWVCEEDVTNKVLVLEWPVNWSWWRSKVWGGCEEDVSKQVTWMACELLKKQGVVIVVKYRLVGIVCSTRE
jgi:hypothetical protein